MIWRFERSSRGAGRAAGFTLIELMVVLAILGLMAGLFLDYPAHRSRTLDLKAAAGELAGELRLARSQAIARNQPVALALDVGSHHYGIVGSRPRALPADLSIELMTIAGERTGARSGDIRFNPDGSSTGGRILLTDGHRRIAVGVEWLTGQVTVADVR